MYACILHTHVYNTYICIYIYACVQYAGAYRKLIYTHMLTRVCAYTHTYVRTCITLYGFRCVQSCLHMYACQYVLAKILACKWPYVCVQPCMNSCIHHGTCEGLVSGGSGKLKPDHPHAKFILDRFGIRLDLPIWVSLDGWGLDGSAMRVDVSGDGLGQATF